MSRFDDYRRGVETGVMKSATPNVVRDLLDEIDRLRAIVDRLPKTADGVPVVIGDTVYSIGSPDGVVRERRVWSLEPPFLGLQIGVMTGTRMHCSAGWCYSTREAAEKARKL